MQRGLRSLGSPCVPDAVAKTVETTISTSPAHGSPLPRSLSELRAYCGRHPPPQLSWVGAL